MCFSVSLVRRWESLKEIPSQGLCWANEDSSCPTCPWSLLHSSSAILATHDLADASSAFFCGYLGSWVQSPGLDAASFTPSLQTSRFAQAPSASLASIQYPNPNGTRVRLGSGEPSADLGHLPLHMALLTPTRATVTDPPASFSRGQSPVLRRGSCTRWPALRNWTGRSQVITTFTRW